MVIPEIKATIKYAHILSKNAGLSIALWSINCVGLIIICNGLNTMIQK